MKTKKLKGLVAIFVIISIFVLSFSSVSAIASEEKGSITLNFSAEENQSASAFRLYRIADAYKNAEGIKYELIQPYDKAEVDLSDLQDSLLPVHLAYFASVNSQSYTEKVADEEGKLVFDNLDSGLYLIVPVESESSPFLVSVPMYNSETKKLEYNVSASPKIEDGETEGGKETYISVVKKWETDGSHPESITVVLLRDFEEYEKITLSESNNWRYRWDNLSGDFSWNVVEENVPKGYTVYYEASSNTITIINKSDTKEEGTTRPSEGETEEDKLVQTGQLNWPVPICAIAGLLLFSMGWAVLNFGKKEAEQE